MLDYIESTTSRGPMLVRPGHGHTVTAFGCEQVRIVVPARSVGGAYGIWELTSQPGFSPPRHTHHREDEIFRVLEGKLLVWCNGQTYEAEAGATAVLPRGVPHSFRVLSPTPARMLMTVVPGGFETFFAAVSGLRLPGDETALIDISDSYGVEYVGGPLQG
ncbi:cupin domain-containing protein [Limobrevibacterium gyesilva]|uniref:Cupin domain-containing protein n=1 Tax=Limobrevibacterium gyesilva TaxID=2991712 RepID=A0AA41YSI4_9PROT|nr:cupin domain-containing protein [Limobrevibacterium gyesilva]MCW3477523.1 cupin domain-containing protein [Limobrevibacterium gyesilva]